MSSLKPDPTNLFTIERAGNSVSLYVVTEDCISKFDNYFGVAWHAWSQVKISFAETESELMDNAWDIRMSKTASVILNA